jgi:hypothetical protein
MSKSSAEHEFVDLKLLLNMNVLIQNLLLNMNMLLQNRLLNMNLLIRNLSMKKNILIRNALLKWIHNFQLFRWTRRCWFEISN